jgi:hypothetical protein
MDGTGIEPSSRGSDLVIWWRGTNLTRMSAAWRHQ